MSKKEPFPHVLWIAAENGALKGGKVGGIGDVVCNLPPIMTELGYRITVLTPSHGFLHQSGNPVTRHRYAFPFRGYHHEAEIYELGIPDSPPGLRQMVIHHPLLSALDPSTKKHAIYSHDPPERPFFTDANRFAFFCKAVAAAISQQVLESVDCIHLHDWHAALVAVLRKFHFEHRDLNKIHTVYSIHNLAFQGIRPLRGDESSLEAWFPEMQYDWYGVYDPRWLDNVNPAAAGIRLSDKVHTVSPSYALEIQEASRKPAYYGGEGLEADLKRAAGEGRLTGILNGCDYPPLQIRSRPDMYQLLDLLRPRIIRWSGKRDLVKTAHFTAYTGILEWERRKEYPDVVLTAVCRVGEQKTMILRARGSDGRPGIESLLRLLGDNGLFILLGEGDPDYERFFARISAEFDNFIFLNGFSEACADALYAAGDLFIMPSSFEPCGLSQMLAMRNGQPCLVHEVGGLKDTIQNGRNGFSFYGETLEAQVDDFVRAAQKAIDLKQSDPDNWRRICENAAGSRYTWRDTARNYLADLYRTGLRYS